MMASQKPGRGARSGRRAAFDLEHLDARTLLSAGFGPHLGHFIEPAPSHAALRLPLVLPALHVDAHRAINREILAVFGPGLDRIERNVELNNNSAQAALAQLVLAQPTVHSVMSNNDTFTLLGQPWLNDIFSTQLLGTDQNTTVNLTLPKKDHILALGDPTIFQVLPGDPAPNGGTFNLGFVVTVPAIDVVFNPDGTFTATVPLSQIPVAAQQSTTNTQNVNNLVEIYSSTGPQLQALFQSNIAKGAPTGLPTVPGLRLAGALLQNGNFSNAGLNRYFRMMRFAVLKQLLQPNDAQRQGFNTSVNDFLGVVDNWTAQSAAQFNAIIAAQPPGNPVPPLVVGPLNNTLAVSLGVIQQPNSIQADAPERIDVGFIFAKNGDYGIILTARGSLSTTVPNPPPAPAPIVAGDIQTAVSNAANLTALNGWREVEGLAEGNVLSATISETSTGGPATFAASAGYGGGFDFGLGVQFTKVIPLGNVFTRPLG